MRRKEKEIKDRQRIEDIMKKALVCRIAMCDNGAPYLVPVNFGYENNAIYIHTAYEGKKIDILRKNNRVCFEMESDVQLVSGDAVCDWGTLYASVIGHGRAEFIEDQEGKRIWKWEAISCWSSVLTLAKTISGYFSAVASNTGLKD